jgi:hypothetical protein
MMEKEVWEGINYVSMVKMYSSCPALIILQCKIFYSTEAPPLHPGISMKEFERKEMSARKVVTVPSQTEMDFEAACISATAGIFSGR